MPVRLFCSCGEFLFSRVTGETRLFVLQQLNKPTVRAVTTAFLLLLLS